MEHGTNSVASNVTYFLSVLISVHVSDVGEVGQLTGLSAVEMATSMV